MSRWNGSPVVTPRTTLNIKDDKLQTIASFPVTGIDKALEAWKACADAL